LSEQLELDDESMTPAQAYAAVRRAVLTDEMLRPILQALIVPLASVVECQGLGSVLPAGVFWEQLNQTLEAFNMPI